MKIVRDNEDADPGRSAEQNVSQAAADGTFRRVARGSIAAFAIYAVSIGLTYVSQLLIARIVGVDIYGMYAYVFAWMTVLAYFSALGFDIAILRFVPAYEATRDWHLLKGVIRYSQRRAAAVGTVMVLVGRIHKGVINAIAYARSLRPQHLLAVYISYEDEDREQMERQWEEFHMDVPLEIVASPYRDLVEPITRFLDELDERWDNDTITVVIPEFVVGKWWEQILHNQSALILKGKLLFRKGVVVTSVPYHVDEGLDGQSGLPN